MQAWAAGFVSSGSATERAKPQPTGSPCQPSPALSNPLAHRPEHGGERPPAWSDPSSGPRLGLLAHFPLASSRRATCSGSHQGGERSQGAKTNRPSSLVHRLVLGWLCAGRGAGGGGEHSWWEDIPLSWRGRTGGGSAEVGLIMELSGLRNLRAHCGRGHTSPQIIPISQNSYVT